MSNTQPAVLDPGSTQAAFAALIGLVPREPRHLDFLVDAETTVASLSRALLAEQISGSGCSPQQATELGERVLRLLDRLYFVVEQTAGRHHLINSLGLSTGLWIARRQGEIRELGPVVNGLAGCANTLRDRKALETLYEASLEIMNAADDFLRADLDRLDRNRPWRLLCLNQCIIATRTGNAEIAGAAYERLIAFLPEDACEFFSLAVQKVAGKDYPAQCRRLVHAYFGRFSVADPAGQRAAVH